MCTHKRYGIHTVNHSTISLTWKEFELLNLSEWNPRNRKFSESFPLFEKSRHWI